LPAVFPIAPDGKSKSRQARYHKRGISEDPALAKGLWDILVIDKFASRHTIAGFFRAKWIAAAGGLAGRLVSWFGVESREKLAGILMAVAFAFAGVMVTQGLIEFGWLWQDALLLAFSSMSVGVLLGLVMGLAID